MPLYVTCLDVGPVIEQCGCYLSAPSTRGLMQRGSPGRTTSDVNIRTCGEEDVCHRSGRGVIEWGVPLRLLGIGIGPQANQRRRQFGLAGHRCVVEQSLATPAQEP